MIVRDSVIMENKIVKNLILVNCGLNCDNMYYVRNNESKMSIPDVSIKVKRVADARVVVSKNIDKDDNKNGYYYVSIINDELLDDEYKSDDKVDNYRFAYGVAGGFMLYYGDKHADVTPETEEFIKRVLEITDNSVVTVYVQGLRSYEEGSEEKSWISRNINVSNDPETSLSLLKGVLADKAFDILKDNIIELQKTSVIRKNEIDFKALYERMSVNVKNHLEALQPREEIKNTTEWSQDNEIMLNRYIFEKEAFHAVDTYLKLVIDDIKKIDTETSEIVNAINGSNIGNRYCMFDETGLTKPLRLYPIKDCALDIKHIINTMEICNGLYVYTQYDTRYVDPFCGDPEIIVTNYHSIYRFIPYIIGEIVGYETKIFLDAYENANKFLNVLKTKLEKHINPGISLASCTIDNVSQFVRHRNNRIELLKGLIEVFSDYISICDEFRNKPYIPLSVIKSQSGHFPHIIIANLMNIISDKYYNEDMNSFINKMLKLFEDVTVDKIYSGLEDFNSGSWLSWLYCRVRDRDRLSGKVTNRDFDSNKYWMIGSEILYTMHRNNISNVNKNLLEDIKNKLNVDFCDNYVLQDK